MSVYRDHPLESRQYGLVLGLGITGHNCRRADNIIHSLTPLQVSLIYRQVAWLPDSTIIPNFAFLEH